MDGGEPLRHLREEGECLSWWQRPGLDAPRERLLVQELHGDEEQRSPIRSGTLMEVEHPADVGVGHRSRQLNLPAEPFDQPGVVRLANRLHCHPGVKPEVTDLVYLAHPAMPDRADYLEAAEQNVPLAVPSERLRGMRAQARFIERVRLALPVRHPPSIAPWRCAVRANGPPIRPA